MIHISDKEHRTIRIDFYEYLDLRQIGELFSSGHESSFQIGISNTILRYKHVGSNEVLILLICQQRFFYWRSRDKENKLFPK